MMVFPKKKSKEYSWPNYQHPTSSPRLPPPPRIPSPYEKPGVAPSAQLLPNSSQHSNQARHAMEEVNHTSTIVVAAKG